MQWLSNCHIENSIGVNHCNGPKSSKLVELRNRTKEPPEPNINWSPQTCPGNFMLWTICFRRRRRNKTPRTQLPLTAHLEAQPLRIGNPDAALIKCDKRIFLAVGQVNHFFFKKLGGQKDLLRIRLRCWVRARPRLVSRYVIFYLQHVKMILKELKGTVSAGPRAWNKIAQSCTVCVRMYSTFRHPLAATSCCCAAGGGWGC